MLPESLHTDTPVRDRLEAVRRFAGSLGVAIQLADRRVRARRLAWHEVDGEVHVTLRVWPTLEASWPRTERLAHEVIDGREGLSYHGLGTVTAAFVDQSEDLGHGLRIVARFRFE